MKRRNTNRKAQWAAYKDLQRQVDRAWKTMKSHVKQRAGAGQMDRDRKHLVLLLGECNYMVRELKRLERKFSR